MAVALFEALDSISATASAAQKQDRGRQYERVLHGLALAEGLDPRTRFRPDGEEIDGSLVLDGRTILLEAKWHSRPLPASALYQFKGKIDGKLVGTIGVFISISGFSEEAADALALGKSLNLILFDGSDLRLCLSKPLGLTSVLRGKLRAAAEEGVVYLPSSEISGSSDFLASAEGDAETGALDLAVGKAQPELLCVVEGTIDRVILSTLANRLSADATRPLKVKFVVAHGKISMTRLGNLLRGVRGEPQTVLFVADADGDSNGTRDAILSEYAGAPPRVIVVEPTIEAWLFPHQANPQRTLFDTAGVGSVGLFAAARQAAESVDLSSLEKQRSDFAEFAQLIRAATPAVKPRVGARRPPGCPP